MLFRVRALSDQGPVVDLVIGDDNEGITVQDIQGLDPVDADITSTPLALTDDEVFEHSRFAKRDIILKLGLSANLGIGSVRDVRKKLYQVFRPKTELTLTFFDTEEESVSIRGMSESFVSPLFAEDPTASISITCFKPSFYTDAIKTVTGMSVTDIEDTNYTLIDYKGDTPTGVFIQIDAPRVVNNFELRYESPSGKTGEFSMQSVLGVGNAMLIYTEVGQKGAYLRYLNTENSVLYDVWPGSYWIQLEPGINKIMLMQPGGTSAIPWTLQYQDKYGGL